MLGLAKQLECVGSSGGSPERMEVLKPLPPIGLGPLPTLSIPRVLKGAFGRTAALTRDKYNFILNKHLHSVHSPSGRGAQSSAVLRTSKLPQGPRSSSASSASSCPCSCCTLRGSAASSLRRLRSTIRPKARRSSLSNRTVRESPSSRSRSLSLNEMVARRPSSRMCTSPSVRSNTASGCTWEESRTKTLPLDLTAMKYVSHRLRNRVASLLMVDLCSKMLPDLVL